MSKLYLFAAKLFLSFCIIFVTSFTLSGQRTIKGTVTDAESGEGMIGANVVIIGSGVGTVTDFDGSYSVVVPEGFNTLTFSYTGYESIEVKLSNSDVVNVSLGQGKILDEVVLIGYGTVKREDATGSVQSVSSENFNRGSITNAQELLAGKIPGVVIITGGGPGDGSVIRVRGESSLGASNDPLIVIDGVPVDNGLINGGRNPLNVINPNDIESFTVLKDASAAAIYGNRASAGVILITTKKGKVDGKLRVGYNGNFSTGNYTDLVDVLDADEYRTLILQRFDSTHQARTLVGTANTNWQKEIYRTAIGHDHNLYTSGAVGILPFRLSLGYTDKEGILKTDKFSRITAGLNLNPGFIDNTLQVNLHFKGMFTENQFADRGAIGNALNFDPTQSVRDTASVFGGFTTWKTNNGVTPNPISPTNPIALLELRDDQSNEQRYLTGVSVDYRFPFLTALRANLNLAYDYTKGEGENKVPGTAAFAYNPATGGGVKNIYSQTKENTLLEFYLNYKTVITKHSLDFMAGYSWQHFDEDRSFRNSDAEGINITTDTVNPKELYLLSFFGRANYSYNDRYLLTLSLRSDGTSRFAPENRWGLFPAAALAVKVFENDKNQFNSLKIRAGWGLTGQQEIGGNYYYAYIPLYQIGNESAQYQFGDAYYRTLRPNGYDKNIQWEETETYNLGADFSIIRNRLSGTLDFYKRYTTDLLNEIPVPAGTNLTNFIITNIGNMENQGIEFGFFSTPILTEKITWDFSANIAFNKNEITKLTTSSDPAYQGVAVGGIAGGVGSTIQIHTVGYAPYSFYVHEQLYDESGKILENQFVDRNNDGIVNEQDRYRFEKPAADYTVGFTSRLGIGNFDLSFAGRASLGNYVYDNVQTDRAYLNRLFLSTGGVSLWNVHQAAVDLDIDNQASLTLSDHFVKKADFLKVDHITLGYNFNKVVGDFLRLYVTAQNLITMTKYEGLDPEIFNGIDNNIYPRPRTIVFGVNIEF